MCGIFGYFAKHGELPDLNYLAQLTNSLHHRGPDGGAFWADKQFFLGHRRLSIIDLSLGEQPMASADGRFVITFNGEIYNYIELRSELIAKGHQFKTHSDTEVLINGYIEWGQELVNHLLGMYAFAIVDRLQRTLYLARDRIGEKPFFIYETENTIAFASELRPLAALNQNHAIDESGLASFLCLNYVASNQTLIKNIERLPAATWRFYNNKSTIQKKYWDINSFPVHNTSNLSWHDACTGVKERLDDAVKLTLRSDVPVALFLSGGMDSSLVAESAVRQGKLKDAYCLTFKERSFSELDKAEFVSQKLGLNLHQVILTHDVLNDFYSIVDHADDPLADSSALAVWHLSQQTAKDYKVIISGDGGDELFGGYVTYKASLFHQLFIQSQPFFIRNLLTKLAYVIPINEGKVTVSYKLMRFLRAANLPTSQAHFTWNGSWLPDEAARLLTPDIMQATENTLLDLASYGKLTDPINLQKLQRNDAQQFLINDILVKVDRMTMAHSIESRAPLLNHILAEYAFALPDAYKLKLTGQPKRILRALCESIYGPTISHAKKQGFSIPIHVWLRDYSKELILELLSEKSLSQIPFLNARNIVKLRDSFIKEGKSLGYEIWGLMVLVAWYQMRVIQPIKSINRTSELKRLYFEFNRIEEII